LQSVRTISLPALPRLVVAARGYMRKPAGRRGDCARRFEAQARRGEPRLHCPWPPRPPGPSRPMTPRRLGPSSSAA